MIYKVANERITGVRLRCYRQSPQKQLVGDYLARRRLEMFIRLFDQMPVAFLFVCQEPVGKIQHVCWAPGYAARNVQRCKF